ncbi:putative helicase [Planoprotostelium fungivorum]|uniref:Putative helicase n=1 Tax=Planoprotostelium fungivorum TaxID=1890364 RepID=A0A2P6NI03_9EUKA|nr:putative helicase [Planoprotostelium fungivorum]
MCNTREDSSSLKAETSEAVSPTDCQHAMDSFYLQLLMLSEASEVCRKRKVLAAVENNSSGDEIVGSSDESCSKKLKTENTPSWMHIFEKIREATLNGQPSGQDTRWLGLQIQLLKDNQLSPERMELLKQLIVQLARRFKETEQSTNVTQTSPSSSQRKRNHLASWMCTQRQERKSGELPQYRIQLLDMIGFAWSKQEKNKAKSIQPGMSEKEVLHHAHTENMKGREKRNHELWMTRYHELLSFKNRNGHLKVPTSIEI